MTESYITHKELELVSNETEKRYKLKEGIRMIKTQRSDIEKLSW